MNIFQTNYFTRLQSWHDLKKSLQNETLDKKCIETDNWWQSTPIVKHYLHYTDIGNWPNPWQLLSDNTYCYVARGLGMIYTLLMLGIKNIEFKEAVDYNNEDIFLVIVDKKFILNYWPNTVLHNKLSDFTYKRTISIDSLKDKIK